jgi:OOP family OmpA-OmpF porin
MQADIQYRKQPLMRVKKMPIRTVSGTGLLTRLCFALYITLFSIGSAIAQDALDAASAARNRALDANAPRYAEREWKRASKSWDRALSYHDRNKPDDAAEEATETTQLFDAAELLAIQTQLLEAPRSAIDEAVRNKASRYAPRTLEQARQLIDTAGQSLAVDRYDTDTAAAIAEAATATARHAGQIAAIAATKPKTEDLILSWESYLAELQAAAAVAAATDTETPAAITELATEIERLRLSEKQLQRELGDTQAFNAALEDEIHELDERLGGASDERQQLMLRLEAQARAREQFAQAEALFGPDEAIVFRQSEDIVVRVIGLRFASGSPDLDAGNKDLLAKIDDVVAIYPRALLLVEGHTDSRGSDRINKRLSEQRAQAVANHMIAEMGVPAHRITVVGYGADRPIANNETVEGREKNRRIDLVITPAPGAGF